MEKILTRNIHKENSTSIGVYEAGGRLRVDAQGAVVDVTRMRSPRR